ncbi:MAG: DNA polymerase III subunit gamma/tau [Pyrinomonadaceae bacterium]
MSYQVIARKWRPQSFEEVTGQEPITRTLRNAIEHGRLHHAYLFSGARGVGKTTIARLFAKGLNCHKAQQPTPTPCRTDDLEACASCKEITEGRSIDVQEIDAASHTGVDNVREVIIAGLGIMPVRNRYKIFIIDEVHMLSTQAFNALLKTLEEPPPRVVFIMATTERHKVPETILSRCQLFEFRTIPTARILDRLKLIANAEQIKVPDDALREIARVGEGSMRDAQSALDQVISFAGSTIKKEDVETALGVSGADVLTAIVDAIAEDQSAVILSVVDNIVMRGHDLRNFSRDLLAHLRDLLVTKVSGSQELLETAVCDPKELKRQAQLFSEADLVRFFHSLAETETKLRTAAHPRYQLEVGIVKLTELRGVESIAEILERLGRLESGSDVKGTEASKTPSGSTGSSSPPPSSRREPAARPSRSAAASTMPAANAQREESRQEQATSDDNVPAVVPGDASELDRIKAVLETRRKMFLVTVLDEAASATLHDGELFVEFTPETRHFRDTLAKADNIKILRDACQEVLGTEIGVRIAIKDADAANQPVSKGDDVRKLNESLREKAEKDPTVQQIVRKFRGEIVDVRRLDSSS